MILPGDDADLVVTVRPHQGTKAIIYVGGNGEDVSQNLNEYALEFPDYARYFMHYRGFGGSSGQPTEKDNIQDARALYKKVHQQHRDIALFGRSLGSGIAVHLASEVPISHLILITPYDSILNLAAAQYPLIPVKWLLIDRYQSVRFTGLVTAQTLVIAAEHDLTITRENTDRLFAQFKNGVASLTVISDAGHNDISSKSTYMKAIHAALD